MKKTVSAASPWLKIFWFFVYFSIVFPAPTWPRKVSGSKTPFGISICDVLGMVSVRYQRREHNTLSHHNPKAWLRANIIPLCPVSDSNRDMGYPHSPRPLPRRVQPRSRRNTLHL